MQGYIVVASCNRFAPNCLVIFKVSKREGTPFPLSLIHNFFGDVSYVKRIAVAFCNRRQSRHQVWSLE